MSRLLLAPLALSGAASIILLAGCGGGGGGSSNPSPAVTQKVTGFVTDEYNSVGGYFQVRQCHAHTWVEVLTTQHGWVTFDPTSGRELNPNESRSMWQP